MSSTIYGINSVREALTKETSIDKIFIDRDSQNPALSEIRGLATKHNIPVSTVPKIKLDKLVHSNHQGAVAKMAEIELTELGTMIENAFEQEKHPSFLLLDQINDVGNFGAILRTAACTGVQGVIISKTGSAPINKEVAKRSSGALFHVPIAKVDHLKDAVFYLQSSAVHCAAVTQKSKNNIYQVNFKQPTALIMGNEHRGISPSLVKCCDQTTAIPMTGQLDSLNVSVATSVALYEQFRQRFKHDTV